MISYCVNDERILLVLSKLTEPEPVTYANRGVMATIGKRTGVALLRDQKLHGSIAWFLWRFFYLSNLPTREKKIR